MVVIFFGNVFHIYIKKTRKFVLLNHLMDKVQKWPDTFKKSYSKCCKFL